MLEPLSILGYRLISLGQLEKIYHLSIPHTIWEVFKQELPLEGFPSELHSLLFHDQPHDGPPMLDLSSQHIHCVSQLVLIRTSHGIEDVLHVFHLLVFKVGTSFAIKLGRLTLQEIL